MRLAHGWRLVAPPEVSREVVRDFVRPAVRAVPGSLAARVGPCEIALWPGLGAASSRWERTAAKVRIEVATSDTSAHDVATEVLFCVGQELWEHLADEECEEYLRLLQAEVEAGVAGEIDEVAFDEKRRLLAVPRSRQRLMRYAGASFASTAAEYVHCLWHDVTVREGPEHLPARQLRKRLELMAAWFPPNRGYSLFPED